MLAFRPCFVGAFKGIEVERTIDLQHFIIEVLAEHVLQ